jgi:hypothetical protein
MTQPAPINVLCHWLGDDLTGKTECRRCGAVIETPETVDSSFGPVLADFIIEHACCRLPAAGKE